MQRKKKTLWRVLLAEILHSKLPNVKPAFESEVVVKLLVYSTPLVLMQKDDMELKHVPTCYIEIG